MDDQIPQIFEIVNKISIPGAAVLVVYFLKPVWVALASWIKRDTEDSRIDSLMDFKHVAETNHYTDLDELLRWRRDSVDPTLSKLREDVAYIKGKIGNGSNHKY